MDANKVLEILTNHSGQEVTMGMHLSELGLSSVNQIELIMELEEEFGIELSNGLPAKVADLCDVIRVKCS